MPLDGPHLKRKREGNDQPREAKRSNPTDPQAILDLRLFAHVFNDPDLSGRPLQGAQFSQTISYFNHCLTQLSTGAINIEGLTPEQRVNIQTQAQKLQELFEYFKNTCELISDTLTDPLPEKLPQALSDISNRCIKKLKKMGRILIPGGWRGQKGKSGHSMIYEFTFTQDGQLLFLVWNTGAGIEAHLATDSEFGKVYQPVKAYTIPIAELQKNTLQDYLIKLLEPTILPKFSDSEPFDEKILYQQILTHISFLKGQEIDPTHYIKGKIHGQWSGTCAWQVLAEMARNYGFSEFDDEIINYEIMRYTLDSFCCALKDEDWQNAQIMSQLNFAIKNYAVLLHHLSERRALSIERQQEGLARIHQIKSKLQSATDTLVPEVVTPSAGWQNCTYFIFFTDTYIESAFENVESNTFADYIMPTNCAGLDFNGILTLVEKVLNSHAYPDTLINNINQCEAILLTLPLESAFWEKIPHRELLKFSKALENLTIQYCNLCGKLDGIPYAERITAVYGAIALNNVLTSIIFAKSPEVIQEIFLEPPAHENEIYLLKKYKSSGFFTVTDAALARRVSVVLNTFSNNCHKKTADPLTLIAHQSEKLMQHASENCARMGIELKHSSETMQPAAYYTQCRTKYKEKFQEIFGQPIETMFPEVEDNIQFYMSYVNIRSLGTALKNLKNVIPADSSNSRWDQVELKEIPGESYSQRFVVGGSIESKRDQGVLDPFNFQKNDFSYDLAHDKRSANKIQCDSKSQYLSSDLDLHRQLAHLRSNPESQVVSVIEFFKENLTHLMDPDLQKTIFIDLFYGEYLHHEVANNPGVIIQLIECINRAVDFYNDNRSLSTLTFLLKLNTFLHQYLTSTHAEALIEGTLSITDKFDQIFQALSPQTLNDAKALSQYNNMRLINWSNISRKRRITSDEWKNIFKTLASRNHFKKINEDLFFIKESQKAIDHLKALAVQQYTKESEPQVKQIVSNLFDGMIDIERIGGKFPCYTYDDFEINLLNGTIVKSDALTCQVPENFYQDDTFKELFGTQQLKATTDGCKYFFTYHNEEYCVFNAQVWTVIQRKFFINDKAVWYSLANNCTNGDKCIPQTLLDNSKHQWFCNNGIVITDKKTSQVEYYSVEGEIYQGDGNVPPNKILINFPDHLGFLENFEDKRFIEIWKDLQTQSIHIDFPRYNLHFESQEKHGEQIFITTLENKPYQLLMHNAIPIRNFKGALVLSPLDGTDPKQYRYLVPKQTFLPTGKAEDDFYQCKLDTCNVVKIARHLDHNHVKENIPKKIEKLQATPQNHNLRGQEKFSVFKLGAHDHLEADSLEDKLYLATLYFCAHQPEAAYSILKDEAYHFTGKLSELECLVNIIDDSPSGIINKEQAQEARNCGPEYITVRLYACYLLAMHFKKGDEVNFPLDDTVQGNVNRDAYSNTIEKLNTFFKEDYNHTVAKLLSDYLAITPYIPQSMKIQEDKIVSLITFVKSNSLSDHFYLNVYQKKQELKRLMSEKKRLQDGRRLNRQQSARLEKINQQLHKVHIAIPNAQQLVNVKKIICAAQAKVKINIDFSDKFTPTLHIDALNLRTEVGEILKNLVALYKEAISSPTQLAKLQDYINKKLTACAPDIETLMEKNPSKVVPLLWLSSMLKYPAKTDELLMIGAKGVGKDSSGTYMFGTFSDFLAEHYGEDPVEINIVEHKSFPDEAHTLTMVAEYVPDAMLLDMASEVVSTPDTENVNEPTDFMEALIKEHAADIEAGCAINQSLAEDNAQSLSQFDEEGCALTLSDIERELSTGEDAFEKLGHAIVQHINKMPNNEEARVRWEICLQDKSAEILNLDQALAQFIKIDGSNFRQLTNDETLELQHLLFDYLLMATHRQKLERCKNLILRIQQLNALDQSEEKKSLIYKLGFERSTQRSFDPYCHPVAMYFEYKDNKTIYPKQWKIINKLLNKNSNQVFQSKVIQYIMGGGKSKVLLPLLAKLGADGTNLRIIEVTPELFETNFRDLQEISLRVFGQTAHPFQFHRDIKCDSGYFYQLREHFLSIIDKKDYIVTTRKSIDSLLLKYIELLSDPDYSDEKQKQVEYLDDIINILKNQGDAVLDEIDLNLNPKDQLIYTIGEGLSMSKPVIEKLVNLFEYINLTGCDALATRLINDELSPLKEIVNKFGRDNAKMLIDFFENKCELRKSVLKRLNFTEEECDILAVTKEELTQLLSITMSKRNNVDFGLPMDLNKNAMEREVAIPYIGNNTPNEKSKFQNPVLTANYTILAHNHKALSETMVKQFVAHFKKNYEYEKLLHCLSIGEAGAANAEFQEISQQHAISIDTIDLNDTAQMKSLWEGLKNNEQVRKYCLINFILPTIRDNPKALTANTQSHISLFRSAVGFTGTDYNWRTYHHSIIRDSEESLGTDGRTIDTLRKSLRQTTHVLPNADFHEIFNLIAAHEHKQDIRAFIDCGALCQGTNNYTVANEFAKFYHESDIKQVLFYNENSILCAMSTTDYSVKILGDSENIDKKLDCNANQYFTYYDQIHTTGVDITQAANTIGFMYVSDQNTLRDVNQGAMRLRDLGGTHHIECVQYGEPECTINALLESAFTQQCQLLMKAHLSAGFQKIHHIFWRDLLDRILIAPLEDKARLTQAFTEILYDIDEKAFFDKYAQQETMEEVSTLLQDYMEQVMHKWQYCLRLADIAVKETFVESIETQADTLIKEIAKICEQKHKSPVRCGSENQVIAQRETQAQNELEQQNEKEIESRTVSAEVYIAWNSDGWNSDLWKSRNCVKLNAATGERFKTACKFSDNLYASHNFYNSTTEKNDALTSFQKPCYFVLGLKDRENISIAMITQEDAAELRSKLKNPKISSTREFWIETVGGLPYHGSKPAEIEKSADYQSLMEQVHFYNADLNYLAPKTQSLTWLRKDRDKKLRFLEDTVLPCHPLKADLMPLFKKRMALVPVEPELMAVESTSEVREPITTLPDEEPNWGCIVS